jgi:hypothetical protein
LYSGSGLARRNLARRNLARRNLARRNLAQDEASRHANTPCSGFFGRKNKIGWISLTKGAPPPAVHPPFFVVVSEMRSALSERNLLTTSNPILGNIASARGIFSPSHHCHTPIAHFATFASRTRGSPRLMRLIRQLDSVQEGASRIPCASAN